MAAYAELAELKQYLNIEAADTTRDAMLTSALNAASKLIEQETGRRFDLGATSVTRYYQSAGNTVYTSTGVRLMTEEFTTVSTVVVDDVPVTDALPYPLNALADGRPYNSLVRPGGWGTLVSVTGFWGWPAVPDDIKQATLLQAARLYRRKDSPEGVTGSAEWGVVRLSRTDPDVYALIKHYMLPGFG